MGCRQLDKRDLAAGEVLLVADVAVGSDHRIETGIFRRRQQLPISQPVPAHLAGGPDFVIGEQSPQAARHVRVK